MCLIDTVKFHLSQIVCSMSTNFLKRCVYFDLFDQRFTALTANVSGLLSSQWLRIHLDCYKCHFKIIILKFLFPKSFVLLSFRHPFYLKIWIFIFNIDPFQNNNHKKCRITIFKTIISKWQSKLTLNEFW